MYHNKFVESLNAAVEGFIYVMKSERNMRIHFLAGFFIILLGIYLNFTSTEVMILCTTIAFVLTAEMLNTAIELVVDMVKSEFHPIARIIKDICAGAVLITTISAVIIGYILFSKKIPFSMTATLEGLRQSPWHITFLSLVAVFGLTILGKVIFHRGTPLRGGMPSGHAAIAFAMWTIVAFMTNNLLVTVLVFFMAFLIARHRIKDSVHTFWEVFAGAVLGILATTLIFQLLR
jgi:diacylglycerol kinase (ATP)